MDDSTAHDYSHDHENGNRSGRHRKGNRRNGHGHGDGDDELEAREYVGACAKHFAARAVGRCDDCGELWCSQCLVPTTRKRQPTRCIDCALIAAGVRAPGARRSNITSMSRTRRSPTNLF